VKNYLDTFGKTATRAEENRLTKGCAGVKRTTGQHPGGLVIIPHGTEITDFCPAQYPADSSEKNIITTHFEYDCLEDNLIKLDALGHDDPTMIKMLVDLTGVNVGTIKFDDEDTMSIFKSPLPLGLPEKDSIIGDTGTIGIPEFGTAFTRQMLCDTKPGNFDTLIRLSGFSHGTDVWLGNAKDLIMSGIAGVSDTISCRDDIMLFLISKGIESRTAFSISENVRKGKGLPNGCEEIMIRHKIPEWYIDSCKKIKYLFPKAHAVAYVMMAFRIAWFKVHRPLEFYCAYFYRRSQKDAFDAEYMTRGIGVVKSKIKEINNSTDNKAKSEALLTTLEACYEFYLRGFEFTNLDLYDSDPTKFLPAGDKKLRPPLIAVSGLGEASALDVASARMNTEFISIEDFSAACTRLSKTNIEQLKKLGALRNLPESSQFSMF
jgi:DNA polymerase-3 subunit alpha (Gram-positive type)